MLKLTARVNFGVSTIHSLQRSRPSSLSTRSFAVKSPPLKKDSRAAALQAALKQIETSYGKGSIMKLDRNVEPPKVDVVSTGSLGLDHALGIGGLPRGRIVEIYGPESSGKTTIALQVLAEAQKQGLTCVFIDAEHALDYSYAKKLGVDLDNLFISQPDHGEQALEITDTLVRSGSVDVVVIDSVAALVPRAELEGEMGDQHMALQARLMSQALRKLTGSLNKTNTMIIFLNQIRSKVGFFLGSADVTAGGNALKFYASIRAEIRRLKLIKDKDSENVAHETIVKISKNKLAPPFRVAKFEMSFGRGVNTALELLEFGPLVGVLTRLGNGGHGVSIREPSVQAILQKEAEKEISEKNLDMEAPNFAESPFAANKDEFVGIFSRLPNTESKLYDIVRENMLSQRGGSLKHEVEEPSEEEKHVQDADLEVDLRN